MPNINLIADRRQEKRRIERISKQLFFALGGSLAVFVATGSFLLASRITLMGDVAEADIRMEKLKPILAEIEQVKKETSEKQPKLETLEQARYDTLRWTLLFQAVAESLPKGVWLTTIGAPEGNPVTVNLTGSAPTQTIAGQVVLNLKKRSLFESVEIPNTSRVDKESRFTFQITAQIKPTVVPNAAPPTEEKKTAQATASQGDQSRV